MGWIIGIFVVLALLLLWVAFDLVVTLFKAAIYLVGQLLSLIWAGISSIAGSGRKNQPIGPAQRQVPLTYDQQPDFDPTLPYEPEYDPIPPPTRF